MFLPAVQPFKLELNWLQAQAFRWSEPNGDGWYYGVVHDSLIRVRNAPGGIEFESDASDEALKPQVIRYFRLDQDISKVHNALRDGDDTGTMGRLIAEHNGLRILRQNPWECLVAYICSKRTRVKGTPGMINKLAVPYGSQLNLGGVTCHTLPSPKRLAGVAKGDRDQWRLGLDRESLIHCIASDIFHGHLDLSALADSSYDKARDRLREYTGVGWKIADCVSLFALDKPEAFPVDTNIAKALRCHYKKKASPGAKNVRVTEWALEKFGVNAGYAGQLLFLHQRAQPVGGA